MVKYLDFRLASQMGSDLVIRWAIRRDLRLTTRMDSGLAIR
jgi:hypothetical protein